MIAGTTLAVRLQSAESTRNISSLDKTITTKRQVVFMAFEKFEQSFDSSFNNLDSKEI